MGAGGVDGVATAALRICSPRGEKSGVDLVRTPLTVGRSSPGHDPDVALGPDPQRWVGRLHCTLDLDLGTWSVTDNASVNGTLLRRDGKVRRFDGREALRHGDHLLIVGDMTAEGETSYWELTFIDPHTTRQAPVGAPVEELSSGAALRYDWVTAIAYRCENGAETEISGLRPQGHQLLRYMADRCRGSVAVACGHEELIRALWRDRDEWPAHRAYSRADLAGVVMAVRRRIEAQPSEPKILETSTGIGYRLRVRAEPGVR
jgi:hypothetical protein